MKYFKYRFLLSVIITITLFLNVSCTENIFWDDGGISNLRISGNVNIIGISDPTALMIWMAGFDLVTNPDENGNFWFDLPDPSQSSFGGNPATGTFHIYFYANNCILDSIPLEFISGKLVEDQEMIDSFGTINDTVKIRPLLYVKNIMYTLPNIEYELPSGEVILDRSKVRFFFTLETGNMNWVQQPDFSGIKYYTALYRVHNLIFFSDVILHSMTHDTTFLRPRDTLFNTRPDYVPFDENKVIKITLDYLEMDSTIQKFPEGDYDIIPFILVDSELNKPPSGLLEHLPDSVFHYHSNYLQLPFIRPKNNIAIPVRFQASEE